MQLRRRIGDGQAVPLHHLGTQLRAGMHRKARMQLDRHQ
jgi:hypothetical protein